jgi:hypothetical protein
MAKRSEHGFTPVNADFASMPSIHQKNLIVLDLDSSSLTHSLNTVVEALNQHARMLDTI